jgi:hypothetical protein
MMKSLMDQGNEHSYIHAFANDGFPVFGPFEGSNLLAVSCWQLRDYSNSSVTGCLDGERSCILKNVHDISAGTLQASIPGPNFSQSIRTSTGYELPARLGVFYEDYFYNQSCYAQIGDQFLDMHNGHNHDGIGYHYHLTVTADMHPVFPYSVGPQFYGCIPIGTPGASCGMSVNHTTGLSPSTRKSTCGLYQGMSIPNQQCRHFSFDISNPSSKSTKRKHLLSPGERVGVLLIIIMMMLACSGMSMYYCCGEKQNRVKRLRTVPVQTINWPPQNSEVELYQYSPEDDPYGSF